MNIFKYIEFTYEYNEKTIQRACFIGSEDFKIPIVNLWETKRNQNLKVYQLLILSKNSWIL